MRYYNDSKATNVDATLKALDAFPGRILIILGGKDKGSDYTVLQKPLREKAILALLIGAAADKIEKQIAGSVAIERAETLERAVEIASHAAQAGRRRAAGAGLREFRPVSELRASRARVQGTWFADSARIRTDDCGIRVNDVARRSDTDRWLFGVTLVLCLLGAVMIFSASAVTAQQQFGHSYHFRAAASRCGWWSGLLGMFALMKLDYHRLREPAVVYTVLCVVRDHAGRHVFPGQVARHAPLDQVGPAEDSAFGTRQAGGDSVPGVVSGFEAAQPQRAWNSASRIFCKPFFRPSRPFWFVWR